MGDDALGPEVVRALEATYEIPPELQLRDLGAPGSDLSLALLGLDAAVVVDTLREEGPPGTVRRREVCPPRGPGRRGLDRHGPGLLEALGELEALGSAPERVRLVGVIPARMELGAGLSPAVRDALSETVGAVVAELEALGLRLRPLFPGDARGPALLAALERPSASGVAAAPSVRGDGARVESEEVQAQRAGNNGG